MKISKWFNTVIKYSSISFVVATVLSCGWDGSAPKLLIDSSNKWWKIFTFSINEFNHLLQESNTSELKILDKNESIYTFAKSRSINIKNANPTNIVNLRVHSLWKCSDFKDSSFFDTNNTNIIISNLSTLNCKVLSQISNSEDNASIITNQIFN